MATDLKMSMLDIRFEAERDSKTFNFIIDVSLNRLPPQLLIEQISKNKFTFFCLSVFMMFGKYL